jgi:hypothetical protein
MSDTNGFVLKEHLFFERKPFEDSYIEGLYKSCLSLLEDSTHELPPLVKTLSFLPLSEKEVTYLLKSAKRSDLFKRLDFSLMPSNPATGTVAEAKGVNYMYTKDLRGGRWEKLKTPEKQKEMKLPKIKGKKPEDSKPAPVQGKKEISESSGKSSTTYRKRVSDLLEGLQFNPQNGVSVILRDGSRKKVNGESTSGLIIHKEILQGGKRGAWVVTHSASGLKIVDSFKSKKDAKTATGRIRNLEDWTQSLDTLKQSPIFGELKTFGDKLRDNPYVESSGSIRKKEDELYSRKKKDAEKRSSRAARKQEKEERAERLKKDKQKQQPVEENKGSVKKSYAIRRRLKKSVPLTISFKKRRRKK